MFVASLSVSSRPLILLVTFLHSSRRPVPPHVVSNVDCHTVFTYKMPPQRVVDAPMTGTAHTSMESMAVAQQAAELNNEGLRLSGAGDFAGAERLHLKALDIKLRGMGPTAFSTSISYNELGETYIKMRELEKAESNLKKAIEIRNMYPDNAFDAAVSRENLAQVYEMRGDLAKAKETRLSAGKLNIACAHYKVRRTVLDRP